MAEEFHEYIKLYGPTPITRPKGDYDEERRRREQRRREYAEIVRRNRESGD
jgi:hypothetical protein